MDASDPSFRPLAGLSCINLTREMREECTDYDEFPSPRGVELHKPCEDVIDAIDSATLFPSPRGVELHKPRGLPHDGEDREPRFPSPRGVELHKPI